MTDIAYQDWLDRYQALVEDCITDSSATCDLFDRLGYSAASHHFTPADLISIHKQVLAHLLPTCNTVEAATQLTLRANDCLEHCLRGLTAKLELLQQSKERYQQTVENSPNPIFMVDRQGRIQLWNQACEQVFQYGQAICGVSIQQLLPDRLAYEAVLDMLAKVFAGEVLSNVELTYRCQDGSRRFMLSRLYPVRHEPTDIQSCVVANTDITDRKRAEATLKASETRFQSIAENVAGILYQYVVYPDGTDAFTYISPRVRELYEIDSEAAIHDIRIMWRMVHPEDVLYLKNSIAEAVRTLQPWSNEYRIIPPSGQTKWVYAASRPNLQLDGLIFWDGMMLDISDRKQAETNLQQLNEDLEQRIQERTAALRQQLDRERVLLTVTQRIRESLDLSEILNRTVDELRDILQVDRALIYQVFPDYTGVVTAEALVPGWQSILHHTFSAEVFPSEIYEAYIHGRVGMAYDLRESEIPACLVEFLSSLQVKAILVIPLLNYERWESREGQQASFALPKLWGLLIVHQCSSPRSWESWEVELLQQIAGQLTIAIQQADLYQQAQAEIVDRKRAETQLQLQADADRLLADITQTINQSFQLSELLTTALEQLRIFLQVDRVLIYRFGPDGSGVVELEAVTNPEFSLLGQVIKDSCLREQHLELYPQSYMAALYDTQAVPLSDCYAKLLAKLQVRANLVVPILQTNQLWGLLMAHQCNVPRLWQGIEVKLFQQIALQIGIASQKSFLYRQLEQELHQKELLLKEIHHRVKNNLQVMSSVLKLQARSNQDPVVINALESSRSRLRAIALVHEILYQSTNLEQLDFCAYIQQLTNAILSANSLQLGHIQIIYHLQPTRLNLETAIPCGLLLNEVITNAIKHAFPEGQPGKICIQLENPIKCNESPDRGVAQSTQSHGRYVLSIQDNGIGIPENLNPKMLQSLGLKIIYDLALQLRGTLELIRNNGTEFRLTFSELHYRNRF